MKVFSDFKQKLIDLVGKRARISFILPEMGGQSRGYEYLGRILEVDEKKTCLTLENDPQDSEFIKFTYLNLESVAVYAVDEVDEDADLSDKPEKPAYFGLRTEYIPYDKEGKPLREPQEGYVVAHKDHVYAKGTVYTKLREEKQ